MGRRLRLALATALLAVPQVTCAFWAEGHLVIEALAYRSLVEGHDGEPARPDVLRDLINDGALVPPICFGRGTNPTEECRAAASENPLLEWPQPLTDRPDYNFRRQYSDYGQCIHFMGMLSDLRGDDASVRLKGRHVPRALATTAVVRCINMLDDTMRQVVMVGGGGTRTRGYGLYELMHAVADSFAYAHTERKPGTHQIDFLRVWAPAGALALNRISRYFSESPLQHDADDPRDGAYIKNFAEVEGRPCKALVALPYAVPFACLSEEGDLARRAIVDLLIVVRDLRRAQLHSSPAPTTEPEKSVAWNRFKARWFSPVTPCHGPECQAKEPDELRQPSGLLLGAGATFNPSRDVYDVAAHVRLIEWREQLSPFLYGLGAQVGYRRDHRTAASLGLVGARLSLELPFARRSALGFSPIAGRYAFGGPGEAWEVFTQALQYEFYAAENISVSMLGPVELDWRRLSLDWSFGLVIGYTPSRSRVARGTLIRHREDAADRHDDQWAPEPLWFGRLKGREFTWYLFADATPIPHDSPGNSSVMGGLGALGSRFMWDRDPWGSRLPTAIGGSVEIGLRGTSQDTSYLTATGAAEFRWYFWSFGTASVGLSIVPVRIEGGPKVGGIAVPDSAPGVHGSPPSQYYLQAGSRFGMTWSAGVVDILVQAPTLAWQMRPFDTGEILSLSVGVRASPYY